MPLLHLVGEHVDGILVANTSQSMITFTVAGEGKPGYRLPSWLDVSPVSGVLQPGASTIVQVRGAVPAPEEPASPAGGAASSSSAAHAPARTRGEAVLRVYVRHIVDDGTGSVNSIAPDTQPLLIRVVHTLK